MKLDLQNLGRRELNKRQKDVAIRAAARALFEEHGFEGTTLRQVAVRADVGFGTVCAYASDKVGLLAMAYVEELEHLPALFDGVVGEAELLDQLVAGMAKLFHFWARIPKLSNRVLAHLEFYSESPHMAVIKERRGRARGEIEDWVRNLQSEGKINATIPSADVADTVFALYTSVVREWSAVAADDPDVGIKNFRRLARLLIAGILPNH